MDNTYYKIVKLIFIFFIISLFGSVFKNYMIISYFEDEVKSVVSIASYTSLIVGIIFTCIILVIISYICHMVIEIFDFNVTYSEFSESYQSLLYVLVLGEVIKLILALAILDNELINLTINEKFLEQLEATKWFYYNSLIEKGIIILGSIFFISSFKNLNEFKRVVHIVILSVLILLLIVISSIKWI